MLKKENMESKNVLPPLPSSNWPSYLKKNLPTYNQMSNEFSQKRPPDSYEINNLYASSDLQKDKLIQNNNYMNVIFGKEQNVSNDALSLAYKHTIKQYADSPVDKNTILGNFSVDSFVPKKEATKDSLLKTFSDQRKYYEGQIDSDTEIFLKTRPTHNLISTTFYNKKATEGGQSVRYNHVRGQNELLPNVPDTFIPHENLSSRTFAPTGQGERTRSIPLNYSIYDVDPRQVPIHESTASFKDEPLDLPSTYQMFSFNNKSAVENDDGYENLKPLFESIKIRM